MKSSTTICSLGLISLLFLIIAPCVMSTRLSELLNQRRSGATLPRNMAYNRALSDLNDLERILSGSDLEADAELSMGKEEDEIDDPSSYAQTNWRGWLRNKKNYNLDHLARMNFKRSDPSTSFKRFQPSKFNDRHILGGLRKK